MLKVPKAHTAPKVTKVPKVPKVPKVVKVPKVLKVSKVPKVTKVPKVPKVGVCVCTRPACDARSQLAAGTTVHVQRQPLPGLGVCRLRVLREEPLGVPGLTLQLCTGCGQCKLAW